MPRTLTDADVEAIAQRVAALLRLQTKPELRAVYTTEEFAAEVLGGKRQAVWVRRQCARRRIATVGRRPFLIPRSEAERFMTSGL